MSWRTLVITQRCKLDLKMGYLVIRGEETKRVFLNEVAVLIIESTAVSLTVCLIEELINKKIKVIFCDKKRNPHSELISLYGSFDSSGKIKSQIKWDSTIKGEIWTEIVTVKIKYQSLHLREIGKQNESNLLMNYINEIAFYDSTNREGHAAKVYFNALFEKEFTRNKDCNINSALNYGYSILLSAFNREIEAKGYLTQLGIFHDNAQNFFNLSCDLMEPFRILVDKKIYQMNLDEFGTKEKHQLVSILADYVMIDNTKQTVLNAIKIYCNSVFEALNTKESNKIKFYEYEL